MKLCDALPRSRSANVISGYWLELIIEGELLPAAKVVALLKEADELTAIFTAAQMTSKRKAARNS